MIAIAFNIVIVFAQYYRFLDEEFEDTKGAIRIRISKKNRQHNGQKKQDKRTNNDQQSIHIQLKIIHLNGKLEDA